MFPAGMEVPPERIQMLRDQVRRQVTEMLVDLALIDAALQEKNITVTPEQADAKMKEFAEENGLTVESMLEQFTRSGMTEEDIRGQFLIQVKLDALLAAEMGNLQ